MDSPSEGSYKCNTDGLGLGFMAFCMRNGDGDFIFSKTRIIIEGEIKAIKVGLNYCFQINFFQLIIETDSLTTQKVINGI